MAETKPLPCPFCGAEAAVTEVTNTFVRIECVGPSCSIRPETEWRDSIKSATAAWNNRPVLNSVCEALQFVYEEGLKSEALDCGDHCHSNCMWCVVRAALAKAVPHV